MPLQKLLQGSGMSLITLFAAISEKSRRAEPVTKGKRYPETEERDGQIQDGTECNLQVFTE